MASRNPAQALVEPAPPAPTYGSAQHVLDAEVVHGIEVAVGGDARGSSRILGGRREGRWSPVVPPGDATRRTCSHPTRLSESPAKPPGRSGRCCSFPTRDRPFPNPELQIPQRDPAACSSICGHTPRRKSDASLRPDNGTARLPGRRTRVGSRARISLFAAPPHLSYGQTRREAGTQSHGAGSSSVIFSACQVAEGLSEKQRLVADDFDLAVHRPPQSLI